MDNYKITVGIEPTNKYEKAKQDILVAKISFDALTSQEQIHLINELFGLEAATQVWAIMKRG